jgi:hypothetical protein
VALAGLFPISTCIIVTIEKAEMEREMVVIAVAMVVVVAMCE